MDTRKTWSILNINRKRTDSVRTDLKLKRPVINCFLGRFEQGYPQVYTEYLTGKLGESAPVSHMVLEFGQIRKNYFPDCVKHIMVSGISCPKEYTPDARETFKKTFAGSDSWKEVLHDYVSKVMNQVMVHDFLYRQQIKLCVFLEAESMEAAVFESVLEECLEQLSRHFTAKVAIDIYCLLDQKFYDAANYDAERSIFKYLLIQEIEKWVRGRDSYVMPYILSNYTSQYRFAVGEEQWMEAAARNLILKESQSAVALGSLAAGTKPVLEYTDADYTRRCHIEGTFYSIGVGSMEIEEDTRRKIIYRTILRELVKGNSEERDNKAALDFLGISYSALQKKVEELLSGRMVSAEDLYYVAVDRSVEAAQIISGSRNRHMDVLGQLYGTNLDFFFKWNIEKGIPEEISEYCRQIAAKWRTDLQSFVISQNYTLSDIRVLMEKALEFCKGKSRFEKEHADKEADFDRWKMTSMSDDEDERYDDIVRETGLPGVFYRLGSAYLERKISIMEAEIKCKLMEGIFSAVEQENERYFNLIREVDEILEYLDYEIEHDLHSASAEQLMIENMEEYYEDLTLRFLHSQSSGFTEFSRKINRKIHEKQLLHVDDLLERVRDFAENGIFSSNILERDVVKEIVSRVMYQNGETMTEDNVYERIYDMLKGKRTVYVSDKMYRANEIIFCFIADPKDNFIISQDELMGRRMDMETIYGFFSNQFDHIEIVFQYGRVWGSDIFSYQDVYEKEYLKWKKIHGGAD